MKKLFCLISVVALVAALAACATSAPAATPAPTPEVTETPTPEATPEVSDEPVIDTPIQLAPVQDPDAELLALMDELYSEKPVELSLDTRVVDLNDTGWLRYYTGLETADGIEAALASEPLIGSQAYSVVLLRCAKDADTAAIAQQVADNIDPRKWVCVMADDGRVVAAENIVMLAMVETTLSDVVTAQDMVDAFNNVVGAPETDITIATATD